MRTPRRIHTDSFVTPDKVAAILMDDPQASLRAIRSRLGGGSLRDISDMVHALRDKSVKSLRARLNTETDLGGAVVEVLNDLVSQVALLSAEVRELRAALASLAR